MKNSFLIFILLMKVSVILCQQRIVLRNYEYFNTANGLNSSSIYSTAVNHEGILYIANTTSAQKFDGKYFHQFPASDLPLIPLSTFYVSRDSVLYVFSQTHIHKFTQDKQYTEQIVSIPLGKYVDKELSIINEYKSEIWLYASNGNVLILDKNEFKISMEFQLEDVSNIKFSKFVQHSDNEIVLLKNKCLTKLIRDGKSFTITDCLSSNNQIDDFIEKDLDDYFWLEGKDLYRGNLSNKRVLVHSFSDRNRVALRHTFTKISNHELLITYGNEVLLFNFKNNETHFILKNEAGETLFKNGPITKVVVDKFQNIFLFSLAEGFVKISIPSGQVQSLNTYKEESPFVTSMYYDKKENKLISGTMMSGIRVHDQRGKILFDSKIDLIPINIWQNSSNEYYFTSLAKRSIYSLKKENVSYKLSFIDSLKLPLSYYASIIHEEDSLIYIVNGSKIITATKGNRIPELKYDEIPRHNGKSYITGMWEDVIYLGGYNEIIILDKNFKFIKKYKWRNKGFIRKIIRKNKNEIWIAGDMGLELYDNEFNLLKNYVKTPVFSMIKTETGNLWCGSNNGIFCLNKDEIYHYSKGDGFNCTEYNGNCAIRTENEELYFGGVGGIDRFFEDDLLSLKQTQNFLISSLRVNGSTNIQKYFKDEVLTLPHDMSLLNITIMPMGIGSRDVEIFQHKMNGIDESWINEGTNRNISFHLKPGDYNFYYTTAQYQNSNPKYYKSLNIKIIPPFYKTWWFLSLVCLAISGIAIYIISLINKVRYERKKTIWEVRENLLVQRTELSKELHDLIGSQIGIVSRNIDYIIDEEDTLPMVKMMDMLGQTVRLSKQIAKDVRDTIWASSKEVISLGEFILRVKDYTYHYQYLSMEIILDNNLRNESETLSPKEGLNLLRILQEAIFNAKKHSGSETLKIIFSQVPTLKIDIIDQGKNHILPFKRGHGIDNMEQRAKLINFTFDINVSAEGTHIKLCRNEKI